MRNDEACCENAHALTRRRDPNARPPGPAAHYPAGHECERTPAGASPIKGERCCSWQLGVVATRSAVARSARSAGPRRRAFTRHPGAEDAVSLPHSGGLAHTVDRGAGGAVSQGGGAAAGAGCRPSAGAHQAPHCVQGRAGGLGAGPLRRPEGSVAAAGNLGSSQPGLQWPAHTPKGPIRPASRPCGTLPGRPRVRAHPRQDLTDQGRALLQLATWGRRNPVCSDPLTRHTLQYLVFTQRDLTRSAVTGQRNAT